MRDKCPLNCMNQSNSKKHILHKCKCTHTHTSTDIYISYFYSTCNSFFPLFKSSGDDKQMSSIIRENKYMKIHICLSKLLYSVTLKTSGMEYNHQISSGSSTVIKHHLFWQLSNISMKITSSQF